MKAPAGLLARFVSGRPRADDVAWLRRRVGVPVAASLRARGLRVDPDDVVQSVVEALLSGGVAYALRAESPVGYLRAMGRRAAAGFGIGELRSLDDVAGSVVPAASPEPPPVTVAGACGALADQLAGPHHPLARERVYLALRSLCDRPEVGRVVRLAARDVVLRELGFDRAQSAALARVVWGVRGERAATSAVASLLRGRRPAELPWGARAWMLRAAEALAARPSWRTRHSPPLGVSGGEWGSCREVRSA